PTTSCSRRPSPRRSAPPWAASSAGSARSGARGADALARGRARPPPAATPEAHADPAGQRAPRPGRRQDTVLSAGVLRPPDVRLDPGGDARTLALERGRAGAVCRVHLAPEPLPVLNGR